jgi:hypothetical protein
MENLLSFWPSLLLVMLTMMFFIVFWLVIRKMIQRDYELRLLDVKIDTNKAILNLRLQAYERLILLLERLHPEAMIDRVMQPGMSARELRYALELAIHAEFNHNLSQQMYVSDNAWGLVVSAKEEMIKLAALMENTLESGASAEVLQHKISEGINHSEVPLPTQTALTFLKAEARRMFA